MSSKYNDCVDSLSHLYHLGCPSRFDGVGTYASGIATRTLYGRA